jgi:cyclohexanone monooxygenase
MTDTGKPAQGASFEDVAERYRIEREKRLRPDGNAQYRDFTGEFEEFDRDPRADPDFTRDPVVEDCDVAIIGGGISGLLTAVRLKQRGITNIRVIDRAGDFGGTWYWSRYPGAACDVESYIYMPLLEETGTIPTEKYAKAPEIFEHCQRIATQFDLYPTALFQTLVKDMHWIDEASRWEVETDRGDRIRARFVVTAGGILHKAKLPGIPGLENFKGKSFHTGRWDYDYTGGSSTESLTKLADKRVAIIGTGATGVQIIPRLAASAQQVIVFQRTPSSIGVRGNRPTDPEWAESLEPGWQKARIENFTRIVSGQPTGEDQVADGWTEIFGKNPNSFGVVTPEEKQIDFETMEAVRARVDQIVEDPAVAELLKPWYNTMCKRPCFHDEYLASFNRPNVKLVDTSGTRGVEQITEDSVVVDGIAYPVDCIIYASGYGAGDKHTSRMGFDIRGRDGVSLDDAWTGGPATLHGMTARGFPNLLNIHLLQSGIAINFVHLLGELAIHAAWMIARCIEADIMEIEPSEAAQEEWFHTLLSKLGTQAMFFAECTPGYSNGEGVMDPSQIRMIPYFGPTLDFVNILEDWRNEGSLAGMELNGGKVAA